MLLSFFHSILTALRIVGPKLTEQIETGVDDEIRAGSRPVNLVDHHDHLLLQQQGFFAHKPGLGHGAWGAWKRLMSGEHQERKSKRLTVFKKERLEDVFHCIYLLSLYSFIIKKTRIEKRPRQNTTITSQLLSLYANPSVSIFSANPTFDSIDQHEHSIGHVEHALHFPSKISVARGVDDVDLVARVPDGSIFGKDGDATLTLQIVGVHDSFCHCLVGAEDLGLLQHGIHEGGLAVIDVGDDGDVADVTAGGGNVVGGGGGGGCRNEENRWMVGGGLRDLFYCSKRSLTLKIVL
jgi:hypothetical protein